MDTVGDIIIIFMCIIFIGMWLVLPAATAKREEWFFSKYKWKRTFAKVTFMAFAIFCFSYVLAYMITLILAALGVDFPNWWL